MNDSKWVMITKAQGEFEAELIRGLIEAQEIPVVLFREGAGRAIGLTVGPLGEVEILVPETYAQEARKLVAQYRDGTLENMIEGDG